MTKFLTTLGKLSIIPIVGLIIAIYSLTQAHTNNKKLDIKLTRMGTELVATKAQLESARGSMDKTLREIGTLQNQFQTLLLTVDKTENRVSKKKLTSTNEARQFQQDLSDVKRQIVNSTHEAKKIEKQLLDARNDMNKAESSKQTGVVTQTPIKIEPKWIDAN